jgi:hypothetical protein
LYAVTVSQEKILSHIDIYTIPTLAAPFIS